MTSDSTNQRKRPRWFSPSGPVFWILAPAVVIAATFTVLTAMAEKRRTHGSVRTSALWF